MRVSPAGWVQIVPVPARLVAMARSVRIPAGAPMTLRVAMLTEAARVRLVIPASSVIEVCT